MKLKKTIKKLVRKIKKINASILIFIRYVISILANENYLCTVIPITTET